MCCSGVYKLFSRKGQGIHFHNFPTEAKVKKLWIQKIKRQPGKNFKPASSYVCSSHFKKSDYFPNTGNKRAALRREAVPSKFDCWLTAEELEEKKAQKKKKKANEIYSNFSNFNRR